MAYLTLAGACVWRGGEALWAAPTSRTQHARAAASALSPVETLEQRRLEEQHQLNLAMQYAQGFSGTERQEFFSLFFSRLREGAEGPCESTAELEALDAFLRERPDVRLMVDTFADWTP